MFLCLSFGCTPQFEVCQSPPRNATRPDEHKDLLPADETSQDNVQAVAEVWNISHLLREPHAKQCLRHRAKHLNQTTRTKSAYTSTTSFKKIRRIIVRDCPCSQSLTIKMSEIIVRSQALKIPNIFPITRGGRFWMR